MMRCFIGLMLPEALRDNIEKVQNLLKKLPMDCKMVESENLHICLSFLGDVEDEKVKDMGGKLDCICQRYNSSEVEISGIKLIPSEKYFRVIALDCQSEMLRSLGRDISKEIGGYAYPPHATLCRVRNIKKKDDVILGVKKIESCIGKFVVSSVQIIKSELERDGPKYTVLHESSLS
jgi:RNA 2',3'-cyclic 3'-phosphodiesterase